MEVALRPAFAGRDILTHFLPQVGNDIGIFSGTLVSSSASLSLL